MYKKKKKKRNIQKVWYNVSKKKTDKKLERLSIVRILRNFYDLGLFRSAEFLRSNYVETISLKKLEFYGKDRESDGILQF